MNKEKLQTNFFFGGILAGVVIYAGSKDLLYTIQMMALFWVIAFLMDTKLAIRRLTGKGTPKDNLHAAKDFISKAATAVRNRETEQAEQLYVKAIKLLTVEYELKTKEALPLLAPAYYNLAALQGSAKDKLPAIHNYRDAIKFYHQLFQINPVSFRAELADALYQLAQLHFEKKEWNDAQKNYASALKLFQKVQSESTDNGYYVAYILDQLAQIAEQEEKIPTAIKYAKESIAVYRTLAVKAPKRFKSKLADATDHLGAIFEQQGEIEKAATLYLESSKIYDELRTAEPDIYTGSLAATWTTLGSLWQKNEDFSKAMTYFEKALPLWQASVKKDFTKFSEINLKTQLNWIFCAQHSAKKLDLVAPIKEVVLGYQQLVKIDAENHLSTLIETFTAIATICIERQELKTLEGLYQEAITMIRGLEKEKMTSWYRVQFSTLLLLFASLQEYVMEYETAKKAIEEAISIRRRLPNKFRQYLLKALIQYGYVFYQLADKENVEKPYLEALSIIKNSDKSTFYLENDAIVSHYLGRIYLYTNELEKAETHVRRAMMQIEKLKEDNDNNYELQCPIIMSSLGDVFLEKKQFAEAAEQYQQALVIIEKLQEENADKYQPYIAYSHLNFMGLAIGKQEFTTAEKHALQAYAIYSKAAAKYPWQYDLQLAEACKNLGELYQNHLIDKSKSIQFAAQALDLYKKYKDKRKCAKKGYDLAQKIIRHWTND